MSGQERQDRQAGPAGPTTLGQLAGGIRSKNAGPFWLTIDIFLDSEEAYHRAVAGLSLDALADRLGVDRADLKRFDIAMLKVIKLSLPRPVVQGDPRDRDMHGAAFALLLHDLPLEAATAGQNPGAADSGSAAAGGVAAGGRGAAGRGENR